MATLTHLEAVQTYSLEETATGYYSHRDMVDVPWNGRESWRHGAWMRTDDALAAATRDVEAATEELRARVAELESEVIRLSADCSSARAEILSRID